MNFHELKHLIAKIQKTLPCRDCGTTFKDSQIRIIGTVLNEGYFMALCGQCKNKTLINVQLQNNARKQRLLKNGVAGEIKQVTADDVLDIHNFLKDFKGDFAQLFEKKS